MHKNLSPIKQIIADSSASHVFLHKKQFFHNPASLNHYKNQICITLRSLVTVASSGVSLKTEKESHKFADELDKERYYTITYLINSCGLSPETAISVSEEVCFKTSEKPNSVLALFEKHGFSKTQIATVVRKRPGILVAKQKTLLPKFQFLQSIGISNSLLAVTVSRDPTLLTRSLENQIIPNYNFLKSVLLSDERVTTAMKRTSWVFLEDIQKSLSPNVDVLRELNVPESCIKLLLTHYPETLLLKSDDFRESVSEVSEMGFNPLKTVFVLALHAISEDANKLTWARCYEAYSKWGWSKDDIYMAFRKHHNCMLISQEKISRTMDFFVNKMGWDSRMIATCPMVLFFNLENRIIPRCLVIRVLVSKGLFKKNLKLSSMLLPLETTFLRKFVVRYEKEVPKLLDFYKGMVSVEEL